VDTLLPGEWYGGQLHLAPPTDQGGAQKTYTVVITVGTDRHVIDVAQGLSGARAGQAQLISKCGDSALNGSAAFAGAKARD